MNAKSELVTKKENQPAVTSVNESAAMFQLIERVATNPDADIEKMERLWAMKERIDAKQAEMLFHTAFVETQTKMRPISADATNPQTRSKYASYAKLDNALRPIYTDDGFALSFDTADSPLDLHVRVLCYVSHKSGHSRTHHIDMPADGKGAKGGDVMTKTHATGAALSYGMRYLLKMIFNVAVGEDDRDGNQPIPRITEEQANEIHAKITENEISMDGFVRWLRTDLKCDAISDININALGIVNKRIDSAIRAQK